jgi:hypothetical protein
MSATCQQATCARTRGLKATPGLALLASLGRNLDSGLEREILMLDRLVTFARAGWRQ